MPVVYKNAALTLLEGPDEAELCAHLPPLVAAKIVRHLHPDTGNWERGEAQCTRVLNVVYNPWAVEAFYETRRPDGKTGTQFMRFYPWSAVMRCLAVTTDGRVVLLQEHRRGRGAWVDGMHVAGGVPQGDAVFAVKDELFLESGCKLSPMSTVRRIASVYMDDGIFHDKLDLLVVDHVIAPESHQNPDESIRGIRLMTWDAWKTAALTGELDDIYATIFAARCTYDAGTRCVFVRGRSEVLRSPK